MDLAALRSERMRSHRLSAPAANIADAASHMLATQAQDFAGGRWALGVRTRGTPTMRELDAAFDRGSLIRAWTQRGTIHIIRPADLGWMLALTGDRQHRQAHSRHVQLRLDAGDLRRAERAVGKALRGGERLTRAGLFDVLRGIRIDPAGQRGVHVLYALAVRGLVCLGPVVPRATGPTREQYIVLTDDWVKDATVPADPLGEFFARYIDGHGPASAADFAWWSGLPIGMARKAAQAATDELGTVSYDGESLFVSRSRPRRSSKAADVLALPPFEEYFLSYADRSQNCAPELVSTIAQGGMMRPILLAHGEIVGVWTHSLAVGRKASDPVPDLLLPHSATRTEIAAALERYRAFVTG